jgi:hypothetical protein
MRKAIPHTATGSVDSDILACHDSSVPRTEWQARSVVEAHRHTESVPTSENGWSQWDPVTASRRTHRTGIGSGGERACVYCSPISSGSVRAASSA